MTPPELAEAYVDSSAVISVGFGEANANLVSRRLANFGRLTSSNLLEAEVRAAFAREGHEFDPSLLAPVRWIFPNRPLVAEITTVLQTGYLRGADLWHLANALYAASTTPNLAFITLDQRQQAVAAGLGFPT